MCLTTVPALAMNTKCDIKEILYSRRRGYERAVALVKSVPLFIHSHRERGRYIAWSYRFTIGACISLH